MKDYFDLIIANPLYSKVALSLGVLILGYIIRGITVFNINKYVVNVKARHNYRKLFSYIINFFALFIVGIFWLNIINYGVLFSIFGAGIVISLSDVIINFFGWFYLMLRRPFEIGERVQIGDVKGDVVDISASYTTLLEIGGWVEDEQSTGRIVHVPNNFIFRKPVYNYTKGFDFVWNEIKLIITFESDLKSADKICQKHMDAFHESWAKNLERKIKKAQGSYAIYYKTLTPTVYSKIVDNGIQLSMRYLVEPQKRRNSEDFLSRKVFADFSKAKNIAFAYNTIRVA